MYITTIPVVRKGTTLRRQIEEREPGGNFFVVIAKNVKKEAALCGFFISNHISDGKVTVYLKEQLKGYVMNLFRFFQKKKPDPDYLIFGIFKSGDYLGSYTIYKVTDTQLWADTREVWHSERFKPEGYVFKGEELPLEKWNKAKELINTVPQELLTDDWDSFYSTGNKNEDKLVLAFGNPEFQKTITIDTYGIATEKLPIAVGNYRRAVEKLVKEL